MHPGSPVAAALCCRLPEGLSPATRRASLTHTLSNTTPEAVSPRALLASPSVFGPLSAWLSSFRAQPWLYFKSVFVVAACLEQKGGATRTWSWSLIVFLSPPVGTAGLTAPRLGLLGPSEDRMLGVQIVVKSDDRRFECRGGCRCAEGLPERVSALQPQGAHSNIAYSGRVFPLFPQL